MTPYLAAFRAYHREPPGVPWTVAVELHLQRGWVVSTPALFVMARPVCAAWPDAEILDLHSTARQLPGPYDCWHVWAASGAVAALLDCARHYDPAVGWASFQRRGYAVHRVPIIHRHGKRKSPTATATTATARAPERGGSGRG